MRAPIFTHVHTASTSVFFSKEDSEPGISMQVVWDHRKPSEEDRRGVCVNGCVITWGPAGGAQSC